MRNTALMNGGLIGFGLGFILASLTLQRLVNNFMPQYATLWHFRGVAIVGGIGLVIGIGFEVFERIRMKKQRETEE